MEVGLDNTYNMMMLIAIVNFQARTSRFSMEIDLDNINDIYDDDEDDNNNNDDYYY